MKGINVATQTENTTYLITFMAQALHFDTYWPTIERMIDSFEALKILDYENFDIGMRVNYPSNWNKTEDPYFDSILLQYFDSVLRLIIMTLLNYK